MHSAIQLDSSYADNSSDSLAPSPAVVVATPSSLALMQQHVPDLAQREKHSDALAAHAEARTLVRLIQCPECSCPYSNPVTLPCGNSICRSCLPPSHDRERITWPDLPDRRRAITCPIETCGGEHTIADCCIDVALSKVMESIAEVVVKTTSLLETSLAQEEVMSDTTPDAEKTINLSRSKGRLIELYSAALLGELLYAQEINCNINPEQTYDQSIDAAVLADLIETCNKELDCQVCYNLMLDPVTTSCGHTLCRKCLVRSLDHSLHCPVCRRMVLIPPSLQSHPSNKVLNDLLEAVCPDLVAARKEAVSAEDATLLGEFDTPLFVVTLGFPGCPTFLRVFEPRYRLMLRRAMEGNQTFGMVMHNSTGAPQDELGRSHFLQYGTLLRIVNAQNMPDGTSIIETRGISRFKVIAAGTLDGYAVGRVERVEDMPLAEEEANEAAEIALPPAAEGDIEGQIMRMTTQQLLGVGLDFIRKMRDRSAPWLHEGILHAYGGPPDDAAIFPYWFASILPINDNAKYQLLRTRSVRQRLKVTARWVRAMEAQRWYRSDACTVL